MKNSNHFLLETGSKFEILLRSFESQMRKVLSSPHIQGIPKVCYVSTIKLYEFFTMNNFSGVFLNARAKHCLNYFQISDNCQPKEK